MLYAKIQFFSVKKIIGSQRFNTSPSENDYYFQTSSFTAIDAAS
jgi:hypothetical protein